MPRTELLGIARRSVLDASGSTLRTPWKMGARALHRVIRIDEVGDVDSGPGPTARVPSACV